MFVVYVFIMATAAPAKPWERARRTSAQTGSSLSLYTAGSTPLSSSQPTVVSSVPAVSAVPAVPPRTTTTVTSTVQQQQQQQQQQQPASSLLGSTSTTTTFGGLYFLFCFVLRVAMHEVMVMLCV